VPVPKGRLKVAWHEVPGFPVNNDPSRRVRYDRVLQEIRLIGDNTSIRGIRFDLFYAVQRINTLGLTGHHTVPYGTEPLGRLPQALRARLPSIQSLRDEEPFDISRRTWKNQSVEAIQ
jgi:hypothetical protein